MAIINCPECNEKISNSTSQCIHCGAKITVCPECENVYVGELSICPTCGYALKEKATDTKETSTKSNDTPKQIVERWKTGNPLKSMWNEGNEGFMYWLIEFIAFIPILIMFFSDYNIFSYGVYVDNLRNLIIISAILSIVTTSFLEFYCKNYLPNNFFLWAKTEKLNLKKIIEEDLSQDFSKAVPQELEKNAGYSIFVLKSEFLNRNIEMRSAKTTCLIVRILLEAVATFLFASFLIHNLLTFLFIINVDFDFDFNVIFNMIEEWWKLLAAIAINVIKFIYTKFAYNKIDNQQIEWMKKEMPENVENYITYVKNASSYAIDKTVDNSDRVV